MSDSIANYLLLSLPSKANPESSPTTDTDEWLERSLLNGKANINKIKVPSFKIGTLDSLVSESEELSRLDEQLAGSILKIVEILSNLYDNNHTLVNATKKVDDKYITEYLENFEWKLNKFRIDKSIKELITLITNESFQLDTDVKNSFNNYNTAKSNLAAAERKQTGDLSVRSLHDIVSPSDFVLDSDHLQTVLIAVPKSLQKEFLNSYESLVTMVVPRSAHIIKEDSEYYLYTTTLFKKFILEFNAKLRELKFIPREFVYDEALLNEQRKEHEVAANLENRLKSELIRLTRTAFSDIVSNWFHLKTIRVFVESVLRYGLPPNFNTYLIKLTNNKVLEQAKLELINEFGYLGGNAFNVDKKGKLKKDSSLNEYASLVDTDYEPFVIYKIEIK